MKTLVGMVAFGNLDFTKLAIKSIKETSSADLFVVAAKPDDHETKAWLRSEDIPYTEHDENYGFPYSINDIYDYAWKDNSYDYVIIAGNDIIAYPETINKLINHANESDYEWISATQYDVKTLCSQFPEAKKYFTGEKYMFSDFSSSPWNLFTGYSDPGNIELDVIKDVHNLCLYKKSVFDTIGYIDVNFFPAYYSDNDYARRGVNAKLKTCAVSNAIYFHFWSRTIHQGSGGSTSKYFNLNRDYYIQKWGGDFAKEKYSTPFNSGDLAIHSRELEKTTVSYWREKGK